MNLNTSYLLGTIHIREIVANNNSYDQKENTIKRISSYVGMYGKHSIILTVASLKKSTAWLAMVWRI